MESSHLQEIMKWLKTTDLIEVAYNEGGRGFTLSTAEAPPHGTVPACRFAPVTSPALGIFQWSALGRARKAEEGALVSSGETLGVVETSKGKQTPVPSPCAGRVSRLFVEGGNPVEFGQLLLFIEPAS